MRLSILFDKKYCDKVNTLCGDFISTEYTGYAQSRCAEGRLFAWHLRSIRDFDFDTFNNIDDVIPHMDMFHEEFRLHKVFDDESFEVLKKLICAWRVIHGTRESN